MQNNSVTQLDISKCCGLFSNCIIRQLNMIQFSLEHYTLTFFFPNAKYMASESVFRVNGTYAIVTSFNLNSKEKKNIHLKNEIDHMAVIFF